MGAGRLQWDQGGSRWDGLELLGSSSWLGGRSAQAAGQSPGAVFCPVTWASVLVSRGSRSVAPREVPRKPLFAPGCWARRHPWSCCWLGSARGNPTSSVPLCLPSSRDISLSRALKAAEEPKNLQPIWQRPPSSSTTSKPTEKASDCLLWSLASPFLLAWDEGAFTPGEDVLFHAAPLPQGLVQAEGGCSAPSAPRRGQSLGPLVLPQLLQQQKKPRGCASQSCLLSHRIKFICGYRWRF